MHDVRSAMRSATIGLITTAISACAAGGGPHHPTPGPGVSLGVDNEHTLILEIFAMRDSGLARLGTVQPLQSRVFHIPERILGQEPFSLRIIARPGRNTDAFQTPTLSVRRGERILLRVEENLPQSSFTIIAME